MWALMVDPAVARTTRYRRSVKRFFFVFLIYFGIRRAAPFVSSPIHLLFTADISNAGLFYSIGIGICEAERQSIEINMWSDS